MKIQEVLEKTTGFFKEKGIPSARLDAEILLSHALSFDRIQLYLKFDQPLAESEMAKCREAVRRRAQGEPVAYITGTKGFFGHDFLVNNHVLIPRPETEQIVEEAKAWAEQGRQNKRLIILDLGTGSGCIGLSLLKELPQAELLAVDISPEAIALAKQNAQNLGVDGRVNFLCADASDCRAQVIRELKNMNAEAIDILVANPPYIDSADTRVENEVKKFEPHQALFADDRGLQLLKSWSVIYQDLLAQESICLMEMGMDQGQEMFDYFKEQNFYSMVEILKDLSGLDRVIKGVKNG